MTPSQMAYIERLKTGNCTADELAEGFKLLEQWRLELVPKFEELRRAYPGSNQNGTGKTKPNARTIRGTKIPSPKTRSKAGEKME